MIVVYRVNPLLWHGVARWLLRTKKIAMVNILAGQIDLVPEFIPWYGSNQPVIDCALDLLRNPEKLARAAGKTRRADDDDRQTRRIDERCAARAGADQQGKPT